MDIYSQLKDDHGKQRGLSGGLAETSGDSDERRRLFEELKKEIEAHAAAEEETFYAELISIHEGQEKARHSISEHEEAATLLEELTELDFSSSGWLNKFNKLREELEHHLEEEEEEVFKLAKSLIDDKRAGELGEEFSRRKAKLMGK